MSDLLEVADVQEGDGHWTIGYEIGAFQCGVASYLADVCPPSPGYLLGGDPEGTPGPYRVNPFGARVVLNERTTFCLDGDEDKMLEQLMQVERIKAAGRTLWYGIDSTEVFLGASGVTSVAAGSSATESLGAALEAFHENAVGLEPIVHLGVISALRLDWISTDRVRGLDAAVVINPGYDAEGIAITGPVLLRFGSTQVLEFYNTAANRMTAEAIQLGAVEFDPCAAVVVGSLPTPIGGLS